MATETRIDILLPEAGADHSGRIPVAAFVPIVLAIAGVAVILLGGISARNVVTAETAAVDPVATGSIASPSDRRRTIELLDR